MGKESGKSGRVFAERLTLVREQQPVKQAREITEVYDDAQFMENWDP